MPRTWTMAVCFNLAEADSHQLEVAYQIFSKLELVPFLVRSAAGEALRPPLLMGEFEPGVTATSLKDTLVKRFQAAGLKPLSIFVGAAPDM